MRERRGKEGGEGLNLHFCVLKDGSQRSERPSERSSNRSDGLWTASVTPP